eukprot:61577_1
MTVRRRDEYEEQNNDNNLLSSESDEEESNYYDIPNKKRRKKETVKELNRSVMKETKRRSKHAIRSIKGMVIDVNAETKQKSFILAAVPFTYKLKKHDIDSKADTCILLQNFALKAAVTHEVNERRIGKQRLIEHAVFAKLLSNYKEEDVNITNMATVLEKSLLLFCPFSFKTRDPCKMKVFGISLSGNNFLQTQVDNEAADALITTIFKVLIENTGFCIEAKKMCLESFKKKVSSLNHRFRRPLGTLAGIRLEHEIEYDWNQEAKEHIIKSIWDKQKKKKAKKQTDFQLLLKQRQQRRMTIIALIQFHENKHKLKPESGA